MRAFFALLGGASSAVSGTVGADDVKLLSGGAVTGFGASGVG
jgi:hypothetical protein